MKVFWFFVRLLPVLAVVMTSTGCATVPPRSIWGERQVLLGGCWRIGDTIYPDPFTRVVFYNDIPDSYVTTVADGEVRSAGIRYGDNVNVLIADVETHSIIISVTDLNGKQIGTMAPYQVTGQRRPTTTSRMVNMNGLRISKGFETMNALRQGISPYHLEPDDSRSGKGAAGRRPPSNLPVHRCGPECDPARDHHVQPPPWHMPYKSYHPLDVPEYDPDYRP